MTKWLRHPTKTTEVISGMSSDEAIALADELTSVLKDTALSEAQRTARVREIEQRILEEGKGERQD